MNHDKFICELAWHLLREAAKHPVNLNVARASVPIALDFLELIVEGSDIDEVAMLARLSPAAVNVVRACLKNLIGADEISTAAFSHALGPYVADVAAALAALSSLAVVSVTGQGRLLVK